MEIANLTVLAGGPCERLEPFDMRLAVPPVMCYTVSHEGVTPRSFRGVGVGAPIRGNRRRGGAFKSVRKCVRGDDAEQSRQARQPCPARDGWNASHR